MPGNQKNNKQEQENAPSTSMGNALAETTLASTAIGAGELSDMVGTVFQESYEDAFLGKIGGKLVSMPLTVAGHAASYVRNLNNNKNDHQKALNQTGKDIIVDGAKTAAFAVVGLPPQIAMGMAVADAITPITDALADRIENPILKTALKIPGYISSGENTAKEFIEETIVQTSTMAHECGNNIKEDRERLLNAIQNENIRPSMDENPEDWGLAVSMFAEGLCKVPKAVVDLLSEQTTSPKRIDPAAETLENIKLNNTASDEVKNITGMIDNTSSEKFNSVETPNFPTASEIVNAIREGAENRAKGDYSSTVLNSDSAPDKVAIVSPSNETTVNSNKNDTLPSQQSSYFPQKENIFSDFSEFTRNNISSNSITQAPIKPEAPSSNRVETSAGLYSTSDGKVGGIVEGTVLLGGGATLVANATTEGTGLVALSIPLSSTAVVATVGAAAGVIAIGLTSYYGHRHLHNKRAAHVPYFLTFDNETNEQLAMGLFNLSKRLNKGKEGLSNHQRKAFEKEMNAARKIASTPEQNMALDFLSNLMDTGSALKSHFKHMYSNDTYHTIKDSEVVELIKAYDALSVKSIDTTHNTNGGDSSTVINSVASGNELTLINPISVDANNVINEIMPPKNEVTRSELGATATSSHDQKDFFHALQETREINNQIINKLQQEKNSLSTEQQKTLIGAQTTLSEIQGLIDDQKNFHYIAGNKGNSSERSNAIEKLKQIHSYESNDPQCSAVDQATTLTYLGDLTEKGTLFFYQEACDFYTKAAELAPKNPEAAIGHAEALCNRGQHDAAKEVLRECGRKNDNANLLNEQIKTIDGINDKKTSEETQTKLQKKQENVEQRQLNFRIFYGRLGLKAFTCFTRWAAKQYDEKNTDLDKQIEKFGSMSETVFVNGMQLMFSQASTSQSFAVASLALQLTPIGGMLNEFVNNSFKDYPDFIAKSLQAESLMDGITSTFSLGSYADTLSGGLMLGGGLAHRNLFKKWREEGRAPTSLIGVLSEHAAWTVGNDASSWVINLYANKDAIYSGMGMAGDLINQVGQIWSNASPETFNLAKDGVVYIGQFVINNCPESIQLIAQTAAANGQSLVLGVSELFKDGLVAAGGKATTAFLTAGIGVQIVVVGSVVAITAAGYVYYSHCCYTNALTNAHKQLELVGSNYKKADAYLKEAEEHANNVIKWDEESYLVYCGILSKHDAEAKTLLTQAGAIRKHLKKAELLIGEKDTTTSLLSELNSLDENTRSLCIKAVHALYAEEEKELHYHLTKLEEDKDTKRISPEEKTAARLATYEELSNNAHQRYLLIKDTQTNEVRAAFAKTVMMYEFNLLLQGRGEIDRLTNYMCHLEANSSDQVERDAIKIKLAILQEVKKPFDQQDRQQIKSQFEKLNCCSLRIIHSDTLSKEEIHQLREYKTSSTTKTSVLQGKEVMVFFDKENDSYTMYFSKKGEYVRNSIIDPEALKLLKIHTDKKEIGVTSPDLKNALNKIISSFENPILLSNDRQDYGYIVNNYFMKTRNALVEGFERIEQDLNKTKDEKFLAKESLREQLFFLIKEQYLFVEQEANYDLSHRYWQTTQLNLGKEIIQNEINLVLQDNEKGDLVQAMQYINKLKKASTKEDPILIAFEKKVGILQEMIKSSDQQDPQFIGAKLKKLDGCSLRIIYSNLSHEDKKRVEHSKEVLIFLDKKEQAYKIYFNQKGKCCVIVIEDPEIQKRLKVYIDKKLTGIGPELNNALNEIITIWPDTVLLSNDRIECASFFMNLCMQEIQKIEEKLANLKKNINKTEEDIKSESKPLEDALVAIAKKGYLIVDQEFEDYPRNDYYFVSWLRFGVKLNEKNRDTTTMLSTIKSKLNNGNDTSKELVSEMQDATYLLGLKSDVVNRKFAIEMLESIIDVHNMAALPKEKAKIHRYLAGLKGKDVCVDRLQSFDHSQKAFELEPENIEGSVSYAQECALRMGYNQAINVLEITLEKIPESDPDADIKRKCLNDQIREMKNRAISAGSFYGNMTLKLIILLAHKASQSDYINEANKENAEQIEKWAKLIGAPANFVVQVLQHSMLLFPDKADKKYDTLSQAFYFSEAQLIYAMANLGLQSFGPHLKSTILNVDVLQTEISIASSWKNMYDVLSKISSQTTPKEWIASGLDCTKFLTTPAAFLQRHWLEQCRQKGNLPTALPLIMAEDLITTLNHPVTSNILNIYSNRSVIRDGMGWVLSLCPSIVSRYLEFYVNGGNAFIDGAGRMIAANSNMMIGVMAFMLSTSFSQYYNDRWYQNMLSNTRTKLALVDQNKDCTVYLEEAIQNLNRILEYFPNDIAVLKLKTTIQSIQQTYKKEEITIEKMVNDLDASLKDDPNSAAMLVLTKMRVIVAASAENSTLSSEEKKKWCIEGITAAKQLFNLHPSLEITALYHQLNFESSSGKMEEAWITLGELEKKQDNLSDDFKEMLQKTRDQFIQFFPQIANQESSESHANKKIISKKKTENSTNITKQDNTLRDTIICVGGIALTLTGNPAGVSYFFMSMMFHLNYCDQKKTNSVSSSSAQLIAKRGYSSESVTQNIGPSSSIEYGATLSSIR